MNGVFKNSYLNVVKELCEIQKKCNIDCEESEKLKEAINNAKLPMPVVGEFSSGKSSFLNGCIGKNILSVDISPETAVPAELYYSSEEYNEYVDKNGNIIKSDNINNIPENCAYVKRYINSNFLKEIDPVIPVDMPGFDSKIENHNKSIISYLDKGCHYIVMIPVNAGTISNSLLNQIQNIMTFKKECSFILSKCDLKSKEETKEVKEYIESQLKDITGSEIKLLTVKQGGISYSDLLSEINTDRIFRNTFKGLIEQDLYNTRDSLNIKIHSIINKKENSEKLIAELKSAKENLEEKYSHSLENEKRRTFASEAEQVSNKIAEELNRRLDELAAIAISGGESALKEEINILIERTGIDNIKNIVEKIGTNVTEKLSADMNTLNNIFESFGIPNMLEKIQNVTKDIFTVGKIKINDLIKANTKSSNSAIWTAVMGVLGIATNILSPVIEAILVMLPTIIEKIFSYYNESRKKDRIKEAIALQIPSIKKAVRERVSDVLKENSIKLFSAAAESIKAELQSKEKDLRNALKDKESENDEAMLSLYKTSLESVNALISKIS